MSRRREEYRWSSLTVRRDVKLTTLRTSRAKTNLRKKFIVICLCFTIAHSIVYFFQRFTIPSVRRARLYSGQLLGLPPYPPCHRLLGLHLRGIGVGFAVNLELGVRVQQKQACDHHGFWGERTSFPCVVPVACVPELRLRDELWKIRQCCINPARLFQAITRRHRRRAAVTVKTKT